VIQEKIDLFSLQREGNGRCKQFLGEFNGLEKQKLVSQNRQWIVNYSFWNSEWDQNGRQWCVAE
jgi:hypothetical protein